MGQLRLPAFQRSRGRFGDVSGPILQAISVFKQKRETCEQTKTIRRRHVYIKSIKQLLPFCQSVKTLPICRVADNFSETFSSHFFPFGRFLPEDNPGGGGTLGISGWGCAAGTLEPLTYTRPSSAEFCYPILE